jgi:hypothetical protein
VLKDIDLSVARASEWSCAGHRDRESRR